MIGLADPMLSAADLDVSVVVVGGFAARLCLCYLVSFERFVEFELVGFAIVVVGC